MLHDPKMKKTEALFEGIFFSFLEKALFFPLLLLLCSPFPQPAELSLWRMFSDLSTVPSKSDERDRS